MSRRSETRNQPWHALARCGQLHDSTLFYPRETRDLVWERAAKSFCWDCPVREQCLESALRHKEPGIWGATTEAQRAELRRAIQAVEEGGS